MHLHGPVAGSPLICVRRVTALGERHCVTALRPPCRVDRRISRQVSDQARAAQARVGSRPPRRRPDAAPEPAVEHHPAKCASLGQAMVCACREQHARGHCPGVPADHEHRHSTTSVRSIRRYRNAGLMSRVFSRDNPDGRTGKASRNFPPDITEPHQRCDPGGRDARRRAGLELRVPGVIPASRPGFESRARLQRHGHFLRRTR